MHNKINEPFTETLSLQQHSYHERRQSHHKMKTLTFLIAKIYVLREIYPKFRLYSQCKKRTIRFLLNLMAIRPIN